MQRGWGCHPVNSKFKLNDKCITKLIELYDRGKIKSNKSYRVTVERVYDILRNEIIPNGWCQKMVPTVPKIESFFRKLQMQCNNFNRRR